MIHCLENANHRTAQVEFFLEMAKITLGYWNIRGLAEPIRYLLHHQNVDFVDKRYPLAQDEWLPVKFTLGLDFPNLPYLFDGDIKLSQSITILRYLAQKHHLDGKTPQEKLRASLAEQQLIDLRNRFAETCYSENFEILKPEFVKNAPVQLALVQKFIGNGDFVCGDSLTYVDFMLAEIFDLHSYLMPEICVDFPGLKSHRDRVFGLPGLREYVSSSAYTRWPINGPSAPFGGGGEEPKRV